MNRSSRATLVNRPTPTGEWPLPTEGVSVTHLLVVRDVARARQFYADVLGARVLSDGAPTLLRFYNTWLVLSTEGGPTDDRPDVPGQTTQRTTS